MGKENADSHLKILVQCYVEGNGICLFGSGEEIQ